MRRRLSATGSRPSPDTESAGTLIPHSLQSWEKYASVVLALQSMIFVTAARDSCERIKHTKQMPNAMDGRMDKPIVANPHDRPQLGTQDTKRQLDGSQQQRAKRRKPDKKVFVLSAATSMTS